MIGSVPELIRATIRYVECKSLIAGTTTSQGLTLRAAPIKHLYRGIVRNAEVPDAPGLNPARPKIGDVTPDERDSFRRSLSGKGARIIHLAEGLSTSEAAHQHFLDLQAPDGTWAIGPKFVGIHATALTADDLAVVAAHSGSIVWSPFSNLALYGDTTDIAAAIAVGHQRRPRVGLVTHGEQEPAPRAQGRPDPQRRPADRPDRPAAGGDGHPHARARSWAGRRRSVPSSRPSSPTSPS